MGLDIGDAAPDFTLEGTDTNYHSLSDYDQKAAVCIIFTCNHCPYVQAYEDRIQGIADDFEDCQVICINSNDSSDYPEDSFEEMVVRAEEKEFTFPYLRDEDQQVAKGYGATHTPEAFVFDNERVLRYRGRIDDNWKDPDSVGDHSLRKALRNILSEEDVSEPLKPAIGCTIKWK